ncbi:MAG TPA: beta-galactosidase, partial [Chitinophagaceae bacterium]|nr:beta-galactosidase [Chitinophagaceae bacterium]
MKFRFFLPSLWIAVLVLTCSCGLKAQKIQRFELADSVFLLDGKPLQIISGELHYERIPRPYWRTRLHMARVMGLNTIATYCFWNVHEPSPGKFLFTGGQDVARFVRIAREEGLWVILRPGPYVCAEWEFGGYPWWLLRDSGMKVRSQDPRFLAAAKAWLDALGKQLAPLQVTHGGPILMVQVENEYGSFGKDKAYETDIEKMLRGAGFDVPLFTADGDWAFGDAALPGVLPGANGELDIANLKKQVNRYHGGKGPYFIPEYYPGWLDHWGEPFEKVPADTVVSQVRGLLSSGVSFNFYMFCGGT